MMCMDRRVLEERARYAAARGCREAQLFLRMLNASPRAPTVSRGGTSSRPSAPSERDPFLRTLLRK
jgi:hypothetical protein